MYYYLYWEGIIVYYYLSQDSGKPEKHVIVIRFFHFADFFLAYLQLFVQFTAEGNACILYLKCVYGRR